MSAIQAIKSISKCLFWKPPNAGGSMSECHQNLTHIPQKSKEQDVNKLRDAAAARKQARNRLRTISNRNQSNSLYHDEYWIPSRQALPASIDGFNDTSKVASKPLHTIKLKEKDDKVHNKHGKERRNSFEWGLLAMTATIAVVIVRLQVAGRVASEVEVIRGNTKSFKVLDLDNLRGYRSC
ncbi:hypothetical protein SLA2020_056780 [Shorea laevis]